MDVAPRPTGLLAKAAKIGLFSNLRGGSIVQWHGTEGKGKQGRDVWETL
jgi:hypothetical protein